MSFLSFWPSAAQIHQSEVHFVSYLWNFSPKSVTNSCVSHFIVITEVPISKYSSLQFSFSYGLASEKIFLTVTLLQYRLSLLHDSGNIQLVVGKIIRYREYTNPLRYRDCDRLAVSSQQVKQSSSNCWEIRNIRNLQISVPSSKQFHHILGLLHIQLKFSYSIIFYKFQTNVNEVKGCVLLSQCFTLSFFHITAVSGNSTLGYNGYFLIRLLFTFVVWVSDRVHSFILEA